MRPPSPGAGLGVLGCFGLNTNGRLTYGLAGALFVGAWSAAAHQQVHEVWRTRGMSPGSALLRLTLIGLLGSVICFVVMGLGLGLGATIYGARTGWASTLPLPMEDIALGQGRTVLAYAVAGILGISVGLFLNQIWATIALALITVAYVPLTGALLNRATPLVDLLPWGPFGSLRATLTGNGAIFGADPHQGRMVTLATAQLTLLAWLVVGSALALAATGAIRITRQRWSLVAIPVSLACAAGIATFLPPAMKGNVPWQWTPTWREAVRTHQDSRSVVARWGQWTAAEDTRSPTLLLPDGTDRALGASEALRRPGPTTVQPESSMMGPSDIWLEKTFATPLTSGNVVLRGARFQFRLRRTESGWRIASIEGPMLELAVRPR